MWWCLLAGGGPWVVGLCIAWCLCIIAKRADEAVREQSRSGRATHNCEGRVAEVDFGCQHARLRIPRAWGASLSPADSAAGAIWSRPPNVDWTEINSRSECPRLAQVVCLDCGHT
jgi:hypothetical protein